MRAAIYARYSSDLQRDASIEDQVRGCTARLRAEGWHPAAVYTDHGMSGSSTLRPGYQQLLQDARRGAYDVLLAEGLDRLSRDQEDIAALFKQLSFAGVRMVTLAEGEIGELHVGLKGTMNALFLKDLALKTRRGLEGRVRQGRSGGGLCFGYRVVRRLAANGQPETGLREIVESEATVVRRIFREAAAGHSPRSIARQLNADGLPGPEGAAWQDTAIRGHGKRGTGILNNELYVGRLVWNRQRYVKDPSTGRRVSRPNPATDWIVQEVPELRLVDDDLWQAVKQRQQEIACAVARAGHRGNRLNGSHRPRFLLSGLLVCGVCGGAYTVRGKHRYACANRANRGTCDNGRTVDRRQIEARVLAGLKDRLLAPELVEVFIVEYLAEWNRQSRAGEAAWEASRRELAEIGRRIDGMLDVLERGIVTASTRERLLALEARKAELQAMTAPEAAPRLHPGLARVYRGQVARLEAALDEPSARAEAAEALRCLIERIVLRPGPARGQVEAELHGELGAILALGEAGIKSRTPASAGVRFSVVAGTGFEPVTFRL